MSNEKAGAFREFEREGWGMVGEAYHEFFVPITSRVTDHLLDAAGVGLQTKVLEVATGPGNVASSCLERGASVIAVDISDRMVALAKRLHPQIDFRQAEAEGLPFEDASFDAVVGNFLLPHLAEPQRAIRELSRVLKTKGKLALTMWDLPDRNRLLGLFYDAINEAHAKLPDNVPPGPPMFRFSDEDEFEGLLREAGLEAIALETIDFSERIGSAQLLWDSTLRGSVRTPAMIFGQPEETQMRIKAGFDRMAEHYRNADHLEIPVAVKLGSAEKP